MRTLLLALLSCSAALAQAPAATPDATIQDLLKEVHALRLALERSNQIGPRIQIALARMQLQEERVRNATRQLQDVRERLTGIENRRNELADSIKQLEGMQTQTLDPQARKSVEGQLTEIKAETERANTMALQLRAKEGEAQSALLAEQARWNEADDFLRKIERLLEGNQ